MDRDGRIRKLQAKLAEHELPALLVTNLTNVRYLTGFSGTNGQVLVTDSAVVFFSDPRYEARARDLVQDAEVAIYPARLADVLSERLRAMGIAKLGIEGTMSIAERDDLASRLEGIELGITKGLVEELRRVKEASEIELIREAVALGDETFAWVLDRLVVGATERDVALDIETRMRRTGAEEAAFSAIVGSGPLSAHIHHTASGRAFEKGDLVLLDFGCTREGYCSDLTRTVVLGSASDEQLATYDLVLQAQSAGIDAVRAGRSGRDVDEDARAIVRSAGHADHFGHGLGHGVGLEVHEAPRLHPISEDTLQDGDVVTVEPGVYLPGVGGIRIEDCVVVRADGAEVLGTAPKERLLEL